MLFAVLAPFFAGLAAPFVRAALGDRAGWALAIVPAGLTLYFLQFIPLIAGGGTLTDSTAWVPTLGISLSFYIDGLSLLFALLICGIGSFIVIYAQAYLGGHQDLGRFLMFLLLFMGSMLGLVVADNVVTLFVFWELTSITSFLLIGFNHQAARSRRAALQALIITGGGGLALLAGLLLMSQIAGTWQLSEMLSAGDVFRDHPWYLAALLLVLAGAFTKSAQVPFHFWLPNAMEAPTPVSAYLHSATMVKAGVYLLARLNPVMGATDAWQTMLVSFGALTLLTGAVLALKQSDLKLILAQTTVASLGLLVFLLGLGHDKAILAAMLYLLGHSLFKGALFMVAGSIDHAVGSRDARALSGLGRAMPLTAAAGVLAALSMGGLPPFFGFIAKEFTYKATLASDWILVGATTVAVGGSVGMLVAGWVAGIKPFVGTAAPTPKTAHEGPLGLWLGAVVLAVLGLVSGLASAWPERALIGPAVSAVYGAPVAVDLYLWGGVNTALMLSGLTLVLGLILFRLWARVQAGLSRLIDPRWGPDLGYDQATDALLTFARRLSRLLQDGVLRHYAMVCFCVIALALIVPAWSRDMLADTRWHAPDAEFYVWLVAALVVAGALGIAITRSRLVAIVSMGVLGLTVALVFLLFGAPDLAFTQLMVETLSVVILALVIARLPIYGSDWRGGPRAWRDALLGTLIGTLITLLLLNVTALPLDLALSEYFSAKSYTEAYGRNIVNVILVDFRALDTFGEIAVVVITAVAILGLTNPAKHAREGQR